MKSPVQTHHAKPTQSKDQEMNVDHDFVVVGILCVPDRRDQVRHASREYLLFC